MSYFVTVFNKYSDGTEFRGSFDTESVLLEDVVMDAEIEAFTYRMHNEQNYGLRATHSVVKAFPTWSPFP